MRVIQTLLAMLFFFVVIAWNSSVLFVQAIERLTGGDEFRNPSPRCEILSCQNFNFSIIGGFCTADCCTCKCSDSRATYVEHEKRCVKDTELSKILSIDRDGCQFRSTKMCTKPKLPALGKESKGKIDLCVTKNQDQMLQNSGNSTCDILTAEVFSNGKWKPVTPSGGIENVFTVEIAPIEKLELKWMMNLMSIFGKSIVKLTLKCNETSIGRSCFIFKTATNSGLPPTTARALSTNATELPTKSFQAPVTPLNFQPTLPHNFTGKTRVRHKITSPHAAVAAVALPLVLLLIVAISFLIIHKRKSKSGKEKNNKHPDSEDVPPEPVAEDYDDNFDSDFDSDFDSESGKEEPVYAVIEENTRSSTKDSQHNNSLVKKQVAVTPDGYLEPQDFVPEKHHEITEEKKQKAHKVDEHVDTREEDIYHRYCTVGGVVKSEANGSTKENTYSQDKIPSQSVASSTNQYCETEMAI